MGVFLELEKNLRIDGLINNNYEELIKNMLKRVDAYFLKMRLYDSVDYKDMVGYMKSKLVFETGSDPNNPNVTGKHYSDSRGLIHISIRPDKLREGGTEAEKILCHEFIHAISSYNSILKINGEQFRITKPGVAENNRRQAIRIRDWTGNTMLTEGFTEAIARKIYPLSDGEGTYPASVEMAAGLYDLFSEKIGGRNTDREFLQRNLTSLYGLLGEREKDFDALCAEFFPDGHPNLDPAYGINGDKYKELQKIVAESWLESCLQNIDPDDKRGSMKEYMKNVVKLASSMQNAENHEKLLKDYNEKFLDAMGVDAANKTVYLDKLQQIINDGIDINKNFTKIPFVSNITPRIGVREDGGIRFMFNGSIYDIAPNEINDYETRDGAIKLNRDPKTGMISATFDDGTGMPPDTLNMNIDKIENNQITFEQNGIKVSSNMKAAKRSLADAHLYETDAFAQTL